MKKTLVNIFYNAVYQVFLVLIPMITVPYLSRTLGPTQNGVYSSVNFTIQFLMVFCAIAMSQIGTRAIAKIRAKNDRKKLTEAFWGLWYVQALSSIAVIILTLLAVTIFKVEYQFYFYLQVPFLISAMFDISWFYQGLEEFGKVVLRNTAVKLSSVVLIFAFIKSQQDLWIYMLIMSVTTMLGSFVFWLSIKRYVDRPVKRFYQLRSVIVAVITLIIPQAATQIYNSLDKPILNFLNGSATQVGYYDYSQRISTILLGVITSITVVMMPKMASASKESQRVFLKKSLEITTFLAIIFTIIVMINTKEFVPVFFSAQFEPMTMISYFATLRIIFLPIGEVFSNQFALANKRDKDYAIPVIIGAVLSIILNLILDKPYGAVGAMISLLTVEFVVCLLRIYIVRDAYDAKYVFKDFPKFAILAVVTFVIGSLLPNFVSQPYINMTIKSLIVSAVYLVIFVFMKFEIANDFKFFIEKILKRRES
ncbi:oligosaccharide flippase family protein [Holzapfeliella sp. He02]|uniref:Oligosaccharide flippase family protein n=1 Tax=Holzapfeliella saturejae TaxID=3082953 RepID=A0ABU8SHB0_9LACO